MSARVDAVLSRMNLVVAIDGPAASGKGTVSDRLAAQYRLPYLDTGLLYRAVGMLAQRDGGGEAAAVAAARTLALDILRDPQLRTRGASELASRVAVIPEVRAALLAYQQQFAAQTGGAVLDGRDIGTVIAPDAPAKLFVTAAPEVRAERRWRQLLANGEAAALNEVLDDIHRRDDRDSGRSTAPLARAPDAVLLDTSDLTISQSVEAARRIVEAARGRWETSRSG